MNRPLIFHIDVNSAFLSWEAVYQLQNGAGVDLRLIPSVVGGDQQKRHGVVLAKSTEAKKYKIMTGEPLAQALKKCPNLTVVPPRFDLYDQNSKAFIEILKRFAPVVEQSSIDEAFADMTGTQLLYESPAWVAKKIAATIYEELRFTVNIGISTNKLLAKMASDFEKPDKIHTLFPEEMPAKMWPLPVGDLYFVGNAAKNRLQALGIQTIGDLAQCEPYFLKSHFKKYGETIYQYANGMDSSLVTRPDTSEKSYGNSTTIPYDVTDPAVAKTILLSLCETVCARLRSSAVKCSCVTVQITDCYFVNKSHQISLPTTTNVTSEIYHIVCQLFDQLWDSHIPIRLLGVTAGKITSSSIRQYNLFDMDKFEKMEKLDAAIDKVRAKFGDNAVTRACFLQPENKDTIP